MKNMFELAIRRLRRLLARPTGGSLTTLGGIPPPLALDVGFEVTPSNSLEGQIEVAASNDLKWVLEV